MSDPAAAQGLRDRAVGIIAAGTVLAILYFGRDVLVPITLAVILSLLVAPVVRALRRTLAAFFLPALVLQQGAAEDTIQSAGKIATSFGEALQICLDLLEERNKT